MQTPTRPAEPADITAPLETAYLRPPRVPSLQDHFRSLDALPLVSPLPEPRVTDSDAFVTYARVSGAVAELSWRVQFCNGRIAKELDDCRLEAITVDGVDVSKDLLTDDDENAAIEFATDSYDEFRGAY